MSPHGRDLNLDFVHPVLELTSSVLRNQVLPVWLRVSERKNLPLPRQAEDAVAKVFLTCSRALRLAHHVLSVRERLLPARHTAAATD